VLWQLIDHQATLDVLTSAVPIRLPRSKPEGYRFMDVATRRAVTPRAVYLRAFDGAGKSWVDFVRAIRAVTLFGENFGDLIQPYSGSSGSDVCSRWTAVPRGRDYLAVSGYDLARILPGRKRCIKPRQARPGHLLDTIRLSIQVLQLRGPR
jgi:hypothetical protein